MVKMKIRHGETVPNLLLPFFGTSYGLVRSDHHLDDSGIVEWAYKETLLDLQNAKFIQVFKVGDEKYTYLQLTRKGRNFVEQSIRAKIKMKNRK